jgi:hypothetical protein
MFECAVGYAACTVLRIRLCNAKAYCCIAELCVYGYWIVTFLI